jgi:hypothetical protein
MMFLMGKDLKRIVKLKYGWIDICDGIYEYGFFVFVGD